MGELRAALSVSLQGPPTLWRSIAASLPSLDYRFTTRHWLSLSHPVRWPYYLRCAHHPILPLLSQGYGLCMTDSNDYSEKSPGDSCTDRLTLGHSSQVFVKSAVISRKPKPHNFLWCLYYFHFLIQAVSQFGDSWVACFRR